MRRSWIGTAYYYIASLIGLAMIIAGTVGMLQSGLDALFPRASSDYQWRSVPEPIFVDGRDTPATPSPAEKRARQQEAVDQIRAESTRDAVGSGIIAAVGAPVFLWHIRRARAREEETPGDGEDG